jgi:hypothetical protein
MSLDILIDSKAGTLIAGGSAPFGTLPTLTRNDTYTIRVRPQEKVANLYRDTTFTSPSFKLGIGFLDLEPTSGSFKLTTTTGTSGAIAYNASTAAILAAVSGIAGNVTVATFGGDGSAWLITAATANTALSFSGSSFTLFPPCDVLIGTRLNYASGVCAQVTVALHRSPAVYSDSFTASSTAGQIALNLVNHGSTTANETYQLAVGADVDSGAFVLNYGGTATTAIYIGTGVASFTSALEGINAISTGNIAVSVADDRSTYNISFVGALGYTNITTALTLDATNVVYAKYYQSVVTMNTAEVDQLFSETTENFIEPVLEVEIVDGGTRQTALQSTVKLRRDLITSASAVPTPQANYLTAAESYAAFVEDSNTNVDATNRKLYNSTGSVFLDWQNNSIGTGATILDLSGTAVTITDGYNIGLGTTTGTKFGVSTSSKLSFYGSTPITQPANTNVVTGLINLGLLASSATYGVLPASPYTVTTLTSVTFGTVAGNDQAYRDVTVTGAAVNNVVLLGLPAAVSAGAVIQGVVYKANTVCLSCTNADTTSININTATYRITVIGY